MSLLLLFIIRVQAVGLLESSASAQAPMESSGTVEVPE